MYNTKILSKVYELKERLLNSTEYKLVKEKEMLMEEKCANLLIKYNHLFNEYNNALRFKDYGSDVNAAQRQLHECKIELDENVYVREYKEAYKRMDSLLKSIQKNLFNGIIIEKDTKG